MSTLPVLIGEPLTVALPSGYIGLLGLMPLAMGARQLWRAAPGVAIERRGGSGTCANIAFVALAAMANGADNIGAYVPLFSIMNGAELHITIALFWLLTAGWCAAAYGLVHHSMLGAPLRRYGPRSLPWVLMALGTYVLFHTKALAIL